MLLSPRWLGSSQCRNEYNIFEDVEAKREIGQYVIPILIRSIDRQVQYFTPEQSDTYQRLTSRQCRMALATEVAELSAAEQTALVETIADDVEGMIERRRLLTTALASGSRRTPTERKSKEFSARAHDFHEYDIVTSAEVLIDKPRADQGRNLYAQVDFTERLYIIYDEVRIEFGVQCAFLSLSNTGPGKLIRGEDLRSTTERQNAYYVARISEPESIVVCMEPPPHKLGLAEFALPPSHNINENRVARVAMATAEVDSSKLHSRLNVMIKSDGLWVISDRQRRLSQTTGQWIEAIMTIAARHNPAVRESGRLSRTVPSKSAHDNGTFAPTWLSCGGVCQAG